VTGSAATVGSEILPGGHCSAMEEPDLVVGDVRTLFAQLR
jgi:hypothetical protein